MAKQYHTARIENGLRVLIANSELVYRAHHKELDKIPLSKSKILYEVLKYYLKGTKYEVKDE